MGVGRDLTYLVNVNDDLIRSLTYNGAGRDSPSDLVGAGRDLTYLASDDLVRIWMEIIAMTFTNVSAKGGSTCQFGGRRVIICARHIAIAWKVNEHALARAGGRHSLAGGGDTWAGACCSLVDPMLT
ncbi:hypothetical protein JOM56_012637 [Amanita muscaria]